MTIRSRLRDWLGIGVGMLGLLVALLLSMHYHRELDPVAQLKSKYQRVDLVERMRLTLSAASEAEKNAVMAVTDEESQRFADQARAGADSVDRALGELSRLLATAGTRNEADLLSRFSQAFADYRRIDRRLLDLAVKNTNLKAYGLVFGPAAESIHQMDQALGRILARSAEATSPNAKQAMLLAAGAQSGVLRIQADLAPHIAEEGDAKMDALEAAMDEEDRRVHKDLEGLGTLVDAAGKEDLRTATASYSKFTDLRTQIVQLSRQNTNVLSLTVSLNEKRLTVVKCQDALAALEQAIREEPVSDRPPANPREM